MSDSGSDAQYAAKMKLLSLQLMGLRDSLMGLSLTLQDLRFELQNAQGHAVDPELLALLEKLRIQPGSDAASS